MQTTRFNTVFDFFFSLFFFSLVSRPSSTVILLLTLHTIPPPSHYTRCPIRRFWAGSTLSRYTIIHPFINSRATLGCCSVVRATQRSQSDHVIRSPPMSSLYLIPYAGFERKLLTRVKNTNWKSNRPFDLKNRDIVDWRKRKSYLLFSVLLPPPLLNKRKTNQDSIVF